MTHNDEGTTPRTSRGFWGTVGAILKALIQLLLILAFLALLGAGLYYAIPWVYRATVVPVQENTAAINTIEQRVDQAEGNLETRTEALQARNAALEGEITALQETMAVQEQVIATSVARLATLQPGLDELQSAYGDQATDIDEIQAAVQRVSREQTAQRAQIDTQKNDLADIEELLATSSAESLEMIETLADTERETLGRLALLQAAQDLLRVRLQLLEENPGAAQASLGIVTEHLTQASVWWPEMTDQAIEWAGQTEDLRDLIEARSFRATPTLESLWADIAASVLPPLPADAVSVSTLTGAGGVTTTLTTTLTATITSTLTPFPTPTPYVTLTPSPTPTRTPTPLPTPTFPPTPTPSE